MGHSMELSKYLAINHKSIRDSQAGGLDSPVGCARANDVLKNDFGFRVCTGESQKSGNVTKRGQLMSSGQTH